MICLIMFAIGVYLNEKVTSTNYPHINIANQIKVNKLTTVYLKSIISTYCGLSTWDADSGFDFSIARVDFASFVE